MKILKLVAWGLAIGLYYAIIYLSGSFLGLKFGGALAEVIED